jgi:hypothetical protein
MVLASMQATDETKVIGGVMCERESISYAFRFMLFAEKV